MATLSSITLMVRWCFFNATFQLCGQPQALSLRYVVVCFVSLATAFGCLSLTTQLLLFRKNHARLACSVVNALTTAHCRYQLLRIADNRKPCPYHVVVCFVLLATAFGCLSLTTQLLLFRKNHARLACSVVNALTTAHCRYQLLRFADRGKPCPYGMMYNSLRAKHPLLFTIHYSLFSAR